MAGSLRQDQPAKLGKGHSMTTTTKPTLSELLTGIVSAKPYNDAIDEAGVQPAALGATALDEQIDRAEALADPDRAPHHKGKAAALYVLTGELPKTKTPTRRPRSSAKRGSQAKAGRARQAKQTVRAQGMARDIDAAGFANDAHAKKGRKLSQRVTAVECAKTRNELQAMLDIARDNGQLPNADAKLAAAVVPALLGFKSKRAMQQFVDGTTPTRELHPDAKTGTRELTRRIDSHQVWARKAAAAAYGVMQQLDA